MAGIFDLPTQAEPGPSITDFHYERVQATSDLKNIVGNTHIFRVEPSGNDWWYPHKSYFRARLKLVVGFNESKLPSFQTAGGASNASKLKQTSPWPFPFDSPDSFVNSAAAPAVGKYNAAKGVKQGTSPDPNADPTGVSGVLNASVHKIASGWRGESINYLSISDVAGTQGATDAAFEVDHKNVIMNAGPDSAKGLKYFTDFKPFTAMKFVELADCAMDAFFDQMSFTVGQQRVETLQRPQLINVYKHRIKHTPGNNSTRFNTLGVWSDDQYPDIRFNNRIIGNRNSVFDLLGYSGIKITRNSSWSDEYTVTFDVLYIPPLGIFDVQHALPPARYEIELKGAASYTEVNNNFFHCTAPGSLGRWHMDREKTNIVESSTGTLNRKGPATFLDDKHNVGRPSASQHAPRTLFFFEPPVGAGAYLNEKSISCHFLGRGMIQDSWLTADTERSDPGFFLSIQCLDMYLECAMVSGSLLTDSQFVLQYDTFQTQFIPLGTSSTQNLIYDVEPFANHFSFGFRNTNVNDDVCLQAGHMICAANVERDLTQYYINFDMKTRPVNFATDINLKSERGALNEMARSQINNYTMYLDGPETVRTWLKKGPLYCHNWPRDGTSNATRFQLNLELDNKAVDSMGPHGVFENEMPLVFSNAATGFKIPGKAVADSGSNAAVSWLPAGDDTKTNHYYLANGAFQSLGQFQGYDIRFGQATRSPDFWYSLYYPATIPLLLTQARIDCVDRSEDSLFRPSSNADLGVATEARSENLRTNMLSLRKHSLWQTSPSIRMIDSGYRGTEHSRPDGLYLGNTEHSCILFQTVPKIVLINTSMGRVVAVRTIDNRM